MNMDMLEKAVGAVKRKLPGASPVCGLILGSGWGGVSAAFELTGSVAFDDVPGLGKAGVTGHAGRIHCGRIEGVETLIFQGRRHWYEGEGWDPVVLPVYLLKSLGASTLVITNAAGGIREDLEVGDLMAIDDHINGMSGNPLIGPRDPFRGPQFPAMSEVYDRKLRLVLDQAAARAGLRLAHGVYMATSGPIYETPAEIRAFRGLGADAIGMSTVPEAMAARAAGLRVVGLSCISNVAAGRRQAAFAHDDVVRAIDAAIPGMKSLLCEYWKGLKREIGR